MKFAHVFLVTAVCGFFFSFSPAQAQNQPGYATVVRIDGEARYSRGDDDWHALTVGQTLTEGSIIQTAQGASVDLVLGEKLQAHVPVRMMSTMDPLSIARAPDSPVRGFSAYKASAQQNTIRINANSVLSIDRLTIGNTGVDAVSDTELDLRQGSIFGNVKKLSATSQYLIKIPNGIAGVRGTTFSLSATGVITVVQGSMVLSTIGPDGQPITVVMGPRDSYDPATGEVTHLTQEEFAAAQRNAVAILTVVEGIISFADDRTRIYISPTHGRPPGVPPGPPPFVP